MRRLVLLLAAAAGLSGCAPSAPADTIPTVKFAINGVEGGKQKGGVQWALEMAPRIEQTLATQGHPIHLQVIQDGATDESYKAKMVLDLYSGTGADVYSFDGFWTPQMASAGLLYPLDTFLAGWPDWAQYLPIPKKMGLYEGHTWLVPSFTDVRGIYYRKDLFAQAGLPADWKPQNWTDIFAAG
ncbi:MAG TPA: extracellular solute-binding protein, partial [Candidatus Xenobia bacterium]